MSKVRILVADDCEEMRRLAERTLWWSGFDVVTARDGLEAVEVADRDRPAVVVTDGLMPRLHGFEVSRRIKALDRSYRPRSIILTAVYKGIRYENEAWKNFGVDRYLIKPVAPSGLVAAVCAEVDWLQRVDPTQLVAIGSDPSGEADRQARECAGRTDRMAAPGTSDRSSSLAGRESSVLDLTFALEQVSQNFDLLSEIVELFREESPKTLAGLRRCIEQNDARGVERGAHSLKGSALNFGARRAADSALGLEELGRHGTLERAAEALDHLEAEISLLGSALTGILRAGIGAEQRVAV